jgi:hypothetical protein
MATIHGDGLSHMDCFQKVLFSYAIFHIQIIWEECATHRIIVYIQTNFV